jgi:hypothetical protein
MFGGLGNFAKPRERLRIKRFERSNLDLSIYQT